MNRDALIAVAVFGGALLAIFGWLYAGAAQGYRRGELGGEAIRILRWALLGQICIYALVAVTAFLSWV
ncbi:MAG: hypothetical protein ACRDGQ_13060 [Candidatus Limnocylindrales bacterium]